MGKQRLFVDMDGTLAVFDPVVELEKLYEEGYFRDLMPMRNVLDAVRNIVRSHPEIEVYILSSYLSDSRYALDDKKMWLKMHFPEIPEENCIFVPCGMDKAAFVPGGIREDDYLLDDYSKNLKSWEPPARGIKILNGINGNHGTWQSERISYERPAEEIEKLIVRTMEEHVPVYDALPKSKDYMQSGNRTRMEYENSEDKEFYRFIEAALNNKIPERNTYELQAKIEPRLVNDIKAILDISAEGFTNKISAGHIRHIEIRHGGQGKADKSLANHHNLAKMEYVIGHYDKICKGDRSKEYRNADNTPAQTIILQTAIDEKYYYVVEAVPDSKARSLYVTSAYINKRDLFEQTTVQNNPPQYVRKELESKESFLTDDIIENEEEIHPENEEEFKI